MNSAQFKENYMNNSILEQLEALPRYDLHEDAELNDDGTRNAYVGDCKNGDYIKHSDLRAIIEQYKTEGAEPASKSRIVKDADFQRLEDAIRNLWMSSDENNKKTYDRICKWLDSLEYASPPNIVAELIKTLEDDAYAASFQSMAGYRTALIAKVKGVVG